MKLRTKFATILLLCSSTLALSTVFIAKTTTSLPLISLFIILGALITTAAALLFTHILTQPLSTLYHAAHQLSQGDFNASVAITTGDELEEIGDIFNQTTEALGKLDTERKQIDQAKTRFLSITSHELRSPMTPMRAQLQMLRGGYFGPLTQKQQESVDLITRNAERLDKIIADFLEISRIEAARLKFVFTQVNIAKTIHEVVNYMKGFMPEKQITLVTSLGRIPTIETDSDRISQILRNLISNAIKFSPQKSTIQLSAHTQGDHILFSVKDHGIGISPQDQAKLFEPFFQAEQTIYRERQGNGLGLAISRGIVLSQNGKIWLESTAGKGTTFYFTLPIKPVKDIKPIRVLFSAKEHNERKIAELFKEILGPIGQSEFEDVRDAGLTREYLNRYIKNLQRKGILEQHLAANFEQRATTLLAHHDQIAKTP